MARAGSVAASATQSEGQRFDASREPRVLTRNSQRILHEESWHPSLAVGRRQQHSSTRNRVPVAALGRRGQGTSIARRACSAGPTPLIPAWESSGARAPTCAPHASTTGRLGRVLRAGARRAIQLGGLGHALLGTRVGRPGHLAEAQCACRRALELYRSTLESPITCSVPWSCRASTQRPEQRSSRWNGWRRFPLRALGEVREGTGQPSDALVALYCSVLLPTRSWPGRLERWPRMARSRRRSPSWRRRWTLAAGTPPISQLAVFEPLRKDPRLEKLLAKRKLGPWYSPFSSLPSQTPPGRPTGRGLACAMSRRGSRP